ncbi:hypothetical protein PV11_02553 [Exophiala sideris]|uniref:NmrA-like domain-containing protein n=1 Tax=Exophiala sideris TaxID=1016849 RepID=A0A0D1WDY4_9EURO|nr:hypothetical protein PV11_02553 [Exophiala sideris]
MDAPRTFLVAGGTGRQGGAVVSALLTDKTSPVLPQNIYVITRDSKGASALRLAAKGINLITGSLGQPEPIYDELQKRGVQLNQTAAFLAQAHGPTELSDAQVFINASVEAGLQYFVYSSVDRGGKEQSDRDPSYCKTFSDKFLIERHLMEATSAKAESKVNVQTGFTILRPVWFAENAIWGFPGRLCMTGWRDVMCGKSMQVVVAKDVGKWAVEALLRPDKAGLRNTAVSIASDKLSFQEVDDIFRQETGKPVEVTYGWLARAAIWAVTDLRTMFGFIYETDYGADLVRLAKTVEPTTFRQWVKEGREA